MQTMKKVFRTNTLKGGSSKKPIFIDLLIALRMENEIKKKKPWLCLLQYLPGHIQLGIILPFASGLQCCLKSILNSNYIFGWHVKKLPTFFFHAINN